MSDPNDHLSNEDWLTVYNSAPISVRREMYQQKVLGEMEGDVPSPTVHSRSHTLPTDSSERKEIPLHSGLFRYFPAALAEVAKVSKLGNDKHNPGQEMHHARGKSMDHPDCILRHLMDAEEGDGRDENGMHERAYLAWRALAWLQEGLEAQGAPRAPGAQVLPEVSDAFDPIEKGC